MNDPEPAPAAQPPAAGEPDGVAPQPLGVGVEPTGNDAVDADLAGLTRVDHLPVAEHLAVYEDVHRGLRETLAALDRRPGPPPPGAPHDPRS